MEVVAQSYRSAFARRDHCIRKQLALVAADRCASLEA
jgi:hypothetical protein